MPAVGSPPERSATAAHFILIRQQPLILVRESMGYRLIRDTCLEAGLNEAHVRGEHGVKVAAYLGDGLTIDAAAGEVDCGNRTDQRGEAVAWRYSVCCSGVS